MSPPAAFSGWLHGLSDGSFLAVRGGFLVRIAPDGALTQLSRIPNGLLDVMVVSRDESHVLAIVTPPDVSTTRAVVVALDKPDPVASFVLPESRSLQGGAIDRHGARVALGGFIGFGVYDTRTGASICESEETGIFNGVFVDTLGAYKDVVVSTRVGGHAVIDAKTCAVLAFDGSDTGGTGVSTVSPDGTLVATGVSGGHHLELKRTDPFDAGRLFAKYECPDHVAPTWNRDGTRLLDMGIDGRFLSSFDAKTGRRIAFWRLPAEKLAAVMFDDGRRAAVLYADRVEVVDAARKRVTCKTPLEPKTLDTLGVAVSPDQATVAVSLGGRVTVLDADTCVVRFAKE
ncbi:MAG: hypothetical protein U0271_03260 [Polyangiaceae bacterium]